MFVWFWEYILFIIASNEVVKNLKCIPMKQKLLIVEDNKFMKALLNNLFIEKFDVFCASNGFEALEWMYEGNMPTIIISDLKMPDMDGIEFLLNIRGSAFYSKVPLVMLSGVEKSNERIRCLQLGANDFLLKPFNPEELELRIDKLLNQPSYGNQ